MGFRINNKTKVVHVEHDINDFGHTNVAKNPTHTSFNCANRQIRLSSLFLRTKNKTDKGAIGDNCPLIYALKNKRELSVTYNSFKPLVPNFYEILNKLVIQSEHQFNFDLIIPIPSSHKLNLIIAKRIARIANCPVDDSIFRKSTADDILSFVQRSDVDLEHPARINIVKAVNKSKKLAQAFSLSDVATAYRHYILPIQLAQSFKVYGKRVLLVDDLVSSGSTLKCAATLLLDFDSKIYVEALSLFSPLNGRLKRNK